MEVDQRATPALNSVRRLPRIIMRSAIRLVDTLRALRLTLATVVPSSAPNTRLEVMGAPAAMTTSTEVVSSRVMEALAVTKIAMAAVKNRPMEALVVMKTAIAVATSRVMAAADVMTMAMVGTAVVKSKLTEALAETMTVMVVASSKATAVQTKATGTPLVVMSTEPQVVDMAAARTTNKAVVGTVDAKSMVALGAARSMDLLVDMVDNKSRIAAPGAATATTTRTTTTAVAGMMMGTVSRVGMVNRVAMVAQVATTTILAMVVAVTERREFDASFVTSNFGPQNNALLVRTATNRQVQTDCWLGKDNPQSKDTQLMLTIDHLASRKLGQLVVSFVASPGKKPKSDSNATGQCLSLVDSAWRTRPLMSSCIILLYTSRTLCELSAWKHEQHAFDQTG
jgi:hypothetical protein